MSTSHTSSLSDARQTQLRYIEQGLCQHCGTNAPVAKSHTCSSCRDYYRAIQFNQRQARIASGQCVTCGKPLDAIGQRCAQCTETQTANQAARHAYRRKHHLCTACGDSLSDRKFVLCEPCRSKRRKGNF